MQTALRYSTEETQAHQLDHDDPLKSFRQQFFHPVNQEGIQKIYFSGNSLGLQPRDTPKTVQQELQRWQTLASEGHSVGELPWSLFHEPLRKYLTAIIGASVNEIVLMNGLTVNIHLMLVSFYQPQGTRKKILLTEPAFPSDRYAVQSFLKLRGYDPYQDIVYWRTKPGTYTLDTADLKEILASQGEDIALIWLEGVNYLTGQAMDMPGITELGHQYGCKVGWDLAHTIGNVPLQLHQWQVDFAAWCSYKYLNGGPGAIGGCYIHEKYLTESLHQLAGWYGNDLKTRFKFDHEFIPFPGATRWALSNPPILSMVPLHDSLALFEKATMPALRQKSKQMTQYLRYLLEAMEFDGMKIVTPVEQGCQLSLEIAHAPHEFLNRVKASNVICDLREPNIMRMAPIPLYNSYADIWHGVQAFKQALT